MKPTEYLPLPWKACETYLGRIVAANGLYFDLDTTDDQLVAYIVAAANALPGLADALEAALGPTQSLDGSVEAMTRAALAALPKGVRP